MKKVIALSLFMFLFGISQNVSAQVPVDPDLMERAKMVAEITKLRSEVVAKDIIIAEQKATITTLQKLDSVQEARISDLKEALKYRTEANNLDVKMENLYKDRVAEFKEENQRLRDENSSLRKSRDRRSLLFGIIGLAAGKLVF
jgi:hypothetical protein